MAWQRTLEASMASVHAALEQSGHGINNASSGLEHRERGVWPRSPPRECGCGP